MRHWSEGLAGILDPVQVSSFLQDHYEKEPLHLRRQSPHAFADLLDAATLDRVVTGHTLPYPALRVVKDNLMLAAEDWAAMAPWGTGTVPGVGRADRVLELVRSGHSLVLEQLERVVPSLGRLCARVQDELAGETCANVYYTPGASTCFHPHFDTQEVFVLQCAGRKRWRLWDRAVHLPLPRDGKRPVGSLGEPLRELVLEPGDVLYLPRGQVHAAEALDGPSLHVSVSVLPVTWWTVLRECFRTFEHPILHESVRFDPHDPDLDEAQEERFEALVEGLVDALDASDALRELVRRITAGSFPALEGGLLDLEAVQAGRVGLDTALRAREGVRWMVDREEGRLLLRFHKHTLPLPPDGYPVVRWLVDTPRFQVRELPGGMADDTKVRLCRELVARGFLTRA